MAPESLLHGTVIQRAAPPRDSTYTQKPWGARLFYALRSIPQNRSVRRGPLTVHRSPFIVSMALTREFTLSRRLAGQNENCAPPEYPVLSSSLSTSVSSVGRPTASGSPTQMRRQMRNLRGSIFCRRKHWRLGRFRPIRGALGKVCRRSPITANPSHIGACAGGTTPFSILCQSGVVSPKGFHRCRLFQMEQR